MAEARLSNWTTSQKQAVLNTILPHRPLGAKRDFNARGDARVVTDAVATAGNATLTSATAAFTQSDVGRTVGIPYAGTGAAIGQTHVTTIASVESATSCTLSSAPAKSVAGARTITDAAMSINTQTLTSATANFTAGDIGKRITIPGAGDLIANSGGSPLFTKITAVASSTSCTVAQYNYNATISGQTIAIPGAWVQIGTDDTAAIQAALDAAATSGRSVELEAGRYLTTGELIVKSRTTVFGHGPGVSIVAPVGSGIAAFYDSRTAGPSNPLRDITFDHFEIDGSGVRVSTYVTRCKALYLLFVERLRVTRMYVHDTSATGIGCDFLPNSTIADNVVDRCGAQVPEFGGGAGGSGIGIGTGFWTQESVTVMGNSVTNCGNNGIFAESQSSNVASRGIRIIGNFCSRNGGEGIGDRATEGTVIQGNICEFNSTGIAVKFGFASSLYSTDGLISGNVVRHNGTGIYLTYKDGGFTVADNVITSKANSIGIHVLGVTTGAQTDLVIRGNKVVATGTAAARGIHIASGVIQRLRLEGNTVLNFGLSTSSRRAGIEIGVTTIGAAYVRGNIATDSRAGGAKQQSYGLLINAGTISKLVKSGNDFDGNADGTHDYTGATITLEVAHNNP